MRYQRCRRCSGEVKVATRTQTREETRDESTADVGVSSREQRDEQQRLLSKWCHGAKRAGILRKHDQLLRTRVRPPAREEIEYKVGKA